MRMWPVPAHMQRRQYDAGNDVITIYQEAARADRQMAHVLRKLIAARDRENRKLIDSLTPHLAPGLAPDRAMDRFLACTLVEIYRTLVHERCWTSDDYERWLADLFIDQLLDKRAGARVRVTGKGSSPPPPTLFPTSTRRSPGG